MSNPSLVARLGLDPSEFRAGLEASVSKLKSLQEEATVTAGKIALLEQKMAGSGGGTATQIADHKKLQETWRQTTADAKTMERQLHALEQVKNGGKGMGHGQTQMLAHSGRATLEMMMAGQSLTQALQVEAPKITGAFGGGLGTMLGVGAGFAIFNKLSESLSDAVAKARELKSAFADALRPDPTRGVESIDAMARRVQELDKVIEESKPAAGFLSRVWERISDDFTDDVREWQTDVATMFGGNGGKAQPRPDTKAERQENRSASDERRAEILSKIVERTKAETDLREKSLESGKSSVALAEAELRKKEQLAAIEEKLGVAQTKADIKKLEEDKTQFGEPKEKELARLREKLHRAEKQAGELQHEADRGGAVDAAIIEREQLAQGTGLKLQQDLNEAKRRGVAIELESAKAKLVAAQADLKNGPKEGVEHEVLAAKENAARVDVQEARRAHAIKLDTLATEKLIAEFRGSAMQKQLFALNQEAQMLQRRWNLSKQEDRPGIEGEMAKNGAQTREVIAAKLNAGDQNYLNQIHAGVGLGPDEAKREIEERMRVLRGQMQRNTIGTDVQGNAIHKDGLLYSQHLAQAHDLIMAREEIDWQKTTQARADRIAGSSIARHGYTLDAEGNKQIIEEKYEQQIAQARREGRDDHVAALEKNRDAEKFNADVDEAGLTSDERAERLRHNNQRSINEGKIRSRQARHDEAEMANATGKSFMARFHPEAQAVPQVEAKDISRDMDQAASSTQNNGDFSDKNICDRLDKLPTAIGKALAGELVNK